MEVGPPGNSDPHIRTGTSPPRLSARLVPSVVLIVACGCAALLYTRYLGSARLLWDNGIHDRNAHLFSGLALATDVRLFNVRHLFSDLDTFRSWPPLHDGLLVGFFLLLGRGDERWAVIPSLLGWIGACWYIFQLARRASPTGGLFAGTVAVTFALVSPAERAYATDVMIESLGACLTAACLYYYVAAAQTARSAPFRALALSLTLLFFTKYNYWLLAAFGILADSFIKAVPDLRQWAAAHIKDRSLRQWAASQFLGPLNILTATCLLACLVIGVTGGIETHLFGAAVSLRSSPNLMTIAYLLLLVRLTPWYRARGRSLLAGCNERVRTLVSWHVWPIALWFVWPQKLYWFLWFSAPASNSGEFPQRDLFGGYGYYWNAFAHDYHVSLWMAVAAALLFGIATWAGIRRKLPHGAAAILWFVAIAVLLSANHPNRKSRFGHTWIPIVWAGAGVGAGVVFGARFRTTRVASLCQAALLGAIVVPQLPSLKGHSRAPEGGVHAGSHSILDVTDTYLPDLAGSRRGAVFANIPMKFLAQWTYLQRYRREARLVTDIKGFNPETPDNSACFRRWLSATDCDTVVYVDFAPDSPFYLFAPGNRYLSEYGELMLTQSTFTQICRRILPQYRCTITVWQQKSRIAVIHGRSRRAPLNPGT